MKNNLTSKLKRGKSHCQKLKREKKLNMHTIIGNQLILDNYLLTDLKNKFRDQEIEITLYLPKGTLIKPDASMRNYDRTDGITSLESRSNNRNLQG
jgi:hypothetical protein